MGQEENIWFVYGGGGRLGRKKLGLGFGYKEEGWWLLCGVPEWDSVTDEKGH